jgi:hypothetical protein
MLPGIFLTFLAFSSFGDAFNQWQTHKNQEDETIPKDYTK